MVEGNSLLFSKEGNVAIITMNRPETFNVVNKEFVINLHEYQRIIEKDNSIRAVVLNANGDHFSAGVDLKGLRETDSQTILNTLPWLQSVFSRFQVWSIPVIAAVHGFCFGAATELILGCDIRIAAEDSRLSIPEVRFALSPDLGGTTRLTKLVGPGQAKRLIMGCEEIGAREALRIGLVEIVVPKEQLQERAFQLAQKMASLPSVAIRFAKKGINLAADSSVAAGLLFEQAQSTFCCGSEDQTEAIDAFFEKRKPEFKGR